MRSRLSWMHLETWAIPQKRVLVEKLYVIIVDTTETEYEV